MIVLSPPWTLIFIARSGWKYVALQHQMFPSLDSDQWIEVVW